MPSQPQVSIYKMGSKLGCEDQIDSLYSEVGLGFLCVLLFLGPCTPLAQLQSLQHEYKLAALHAKHQGDTAAATRHLRVAKVCFDPQTGLLVEGARDRVQAPIPTGSSLNSCHPLCPA